jgi:hypothetical protein
MTTDPNTAPLQGEQIENSFLLKPDGTMMTRDERFGEALASYLRLVKAGREREAQALLLPSTVVPAPAGETR